MYPYLAAISLPNLPTYYPTFLFQSFHPHNALNAAYEAVTDHTR